MLDMCFTTWLKDFIRGNFNTWNQKKETGTSAKTRIWKQLLDDNIILYGFWLYKQI